MKKVELLAPAGDPEKLKMAFDYGADAVYMGGHSYGLRAGARNFSLEQIKEGTEYAHSLGKKTYVAVNIIPHNDDLYGLEEYLEELGESNVDALIISDPGIISVSRRVIPQMEIHLSTQANCTNYLTAKFWYDQGVKRIVGARELSMNDFKTISEKTPEDLEMESFVHGAMCMSYSGRCLISNFLTGRNANKGECTHPCRWKYSLVEEKRPGEYFPVIEDERGTYFFNSKDLCMVEYIPLLVASGIRSFKIEGRMKSAYYVATVTKVYREAIDSYYEKAENWIPNPEWKSELAKASNREFTTGFYFGKPSEKDHRYHSGEYINSHVFCGIVKGFCEDGGYYIVEQRNRIFEGDSVEIISPGNPETIRARIISMTDEDGNILQSAPHPKQLLKIIFSETNCPEFPMNSIMRKREDI